MEDNGSLTRVAAFPIGMDPESFTRALQRQDVATNIQQLLARYAGRKVHALIFRLTILKAGGYTPLATSNFRGGGLAAWSVQGFHTGACGHQQQLLACYAGRKVHLHTPNLYF